MKTNLKNRTQKGFTIIEVLIVLAIAGLILLIVFLAVPSLNRNSRNTQRRSDVSKLLAAVQEGLNNSNGTLPASGQFSTVFSNSAPTMAYYTTPANITWSNQATATVVAAPSTNSLDSVVVANNAKCNASGTASVTAGATARSYVAMFNIEGNGGAVSAQCVES